MRNFMQRFENKRILIIDKPTNMLKNFFLITLRNLGKNKVFSIINIAGLAIGMAACILILQYVVYELSFDDFHVKKDRIYRVTQDRYNQGKLSTRWAGGAFAVGSNFKRAFPEVEDFVKIVGAGSVILDYQNKKIEFEKSYFATNSFFNVFSYPLKEGNPHTALLAPNSIVISEQAAQVLFGGSPALGKYVKFNGSDLMEVSGVFKKFPANTHFKTDVLFAYNRFLANNKKYNPGYDIDNAWENDGCLTYLLLKSGTNAALLEAKFPAFVEHAVGKYFENNKATYALMHLTDIHLSSNRMIEAEPNSDAKSVYLLLGISFFIIVIAWINYINLATAKGISRAKEVGVRKTLGSAKYQLIGQFMLESALLNTCALLAALILVALILPLFSRLSGQAIGLSLFLSPIFWFYLMLIFVAGSFFSGFYPALVLSSFRPAAVLKGKLSSGSKGSFLRSAMVVFQFGASIFLLIGSLTVYRQISFMQSQSLGLSIDQTLVIKPPISKIDSFERDMGSFKQELLKKSYVRSISFSSSVPGEPVGWNAGGIKLQGKDEKEGKQYRIVAADFDFLKAYNLQLISGRLFSRAFGSDTSAVVFNRAGVEQLGFTRPEDAIGQKIDFWGKVYSIVGVVENFHQQSLHEAFDQMIFRLNTGNYGDISVKFDPAHTEDVIAAIQQNWRTFFPADQCNYFFLDQHFNQQYLADKQFGQVFLCFTLIAIFIACLGLFGLVSYTIVQRTKEIGIRKVLGASVNTILGLLYKDFATLILISFAISAPIAWYSSSTWLQTYAFRISINWSLFAMPFMIVFVIALLTVSYLSIKAALMNPVKSLRTE